MDLEAEVQRLIDEREARWRLQRYAQALDSDERGRIPSMFDGEGGGRVTGLGYDGPMDEWLPMFLENMDRTFETSVSTHLIGNQLVDVADDRATATTESYCIAHQVADGASSRRGLRYTEHLVRDADGGWAIHDRHVDQLWRTKGNPPGAQPTTIVPSRTSGTER